jgi:hypothetical protein
MGGKHLPDVDGDCPANTIFLRHKLPIISVGMGGGGFDTCISEDILSTLDPPFLMILIHVGLPFHHFPNFEVVSSPLSYTYAYRRYR